MYGTDLALALDPVEAARRSLKIEPDPWQMRLLRSASSRVLLNIHRQAGKSTVTGALATHEAIYEPGSLVLLVSPTERQSMELLRKSMDVYKGLGHTVPADAENKLSLELANGSRVVALPGKEGTIRGFSAVDLLIVDEAARVPDDLYNAVRPMLAVSAGRLIGLSTPWGQQGWFFDEWTKGGDTWERYEVKATECPRISPEFLEHERRTMLPAWFAQEYMCSFEASEGAIFDREQIDALVDNSIPAYTW